MRITTTSGTRLAAILFLVSGAALAGPAEDLYGQGVKLLRDKGVEGIDPAIALFGQAAQADPSFPAALQGIADALILKYEFSDTKDKAWLESANVRLDEVLRLRPGNAKAYFSKATACFDSGNDEEGLRNLQKAYLAAPGDMDINVAYFYRLLELDRVDEAAELAAKSDENFPGSADALKLYGDGFLRDGRAGQARGCYEKAAALAPDSAAVASALGDACKAEGDHDAAVGHYAHALELDGKLSRPYFDMGYCYACMGNDEKAMEMTSRYLELVPDDAAALNNLALYYEKARRAEDAGRVWQKLRGSPSASEAQRQRAATHLGATGGKPAD